MEDFYLSQTFNTPEIKLLPDEGFLSISGRSIPEDPGDIYNLLIAKMEEYFKNPQKLTRVDIRLEYVNSGSSKSLLELLRILKRYYDNKNDCLITWYYEEDDESIYDLGLHYQNTIQIPFKLSEYY